MYEKELLFSAVVKAYGLSKAVDVFEANGLREHAALARALQGSFKALRVAGRSHHWTVEEVRATYEELWVRRAGGVEITVPLVKEFLSFTGFIYLNLPEELKPLGRMIEEEVRRRL